MKIPKQQNNQEAKTETLSVVMERRGLEDKTAPGLFALFGPPRYVGQHWGLEKSESVIGRASSADIVIIDPSVSKAQAKLTTDGDQVFITDLGATNKSRVNGESLAPHARRLLVNNDHITMGTMTFKFLQKGIVSETLDKARMENELEQMRVAQSSILPPEKETLYHNVKVGGRYRAATELSGDWWWHWSNPDHAFALIADAEGHGAKPSFVTGAARAAMATVEDNPKLTLEDVYTTLSRAINKSSNGGIWMSAILIEYEFSTGKIRYINASHVPTAVWLPPPGGNLALRELKRLVDGVSPTLGAPGLDYKLGFCQAIPGARLVLLTDGFTERLDPHGEMPSQRLFLQGMIDAHVKNGSNQTGFLDEMLLRSDEFAKGQPKADDLTIVALDFF